MFVYHVDAAATKLQLTTCSFAILSAIRCRCGSTSNRRADQHGYMRYPLRCAYYLRCIFPTCNRERKRICVVFSTRLPCYCWCCYYCCVVRSLPSGRGRRRYAPRATWAGVRAGSGSTASGRRGLSMAQETLILTEENVITVIEEVSHTTVYGPHSCCVSVKGMCRLLVHHACGLPGVLVVPLSWPRLDHGNELIMSEHQQQPGLLMYSHFIPSYVWHLICIAFSLYEY